MEAAQKISTDILTTSKTDSSAYPLAPELLKIHDACSEFGSHADISSFFHRLESKTGPDNETELLLHYFQFPRNLDEYRFYFLVVVQAFYLMFRIFKLFFDKNLKIVDPGWEGAIAQLGLTLDQRRQAAYARFSNLP